MMYARFVDSTHVTAVLFGHDEGPAYWRNHGALLYSSCSCLPLMVIEHPFALACLRNSPAPTRWLDVEGQPPQASPAEPKLHGERLAHHPKLLGVLEHQ